MKAACMPLTNVAWLIWVITLATWGGVLEVTGAIPTETALFTPASCAVVSAGRCAACQLHRRVADDDVGGADHHRAEAEAEQHEPDDGVVRARNCTEPRQAEP